jgi:hypothetical protein
MEGMVFEDGGLVREENKKEVTVVHGSGPSRTGGGVCCD